jgi:putative addiction module component (TIGR02574 family)
MAMTKEQILEHAMALEPRQREELAEELLLSVDEILDPEWAAEIKRRIAQIDRGEAKLVPADEVFATLRAKYSK